MNFNKIIDEKIAPFSKTANDVVVESDGAREMICNLLFENYFIQVRWDRILIRMEGSFEMLKGLSKSGSIMEIPFFRIFNAISEDSNFGGVQNFVSFCLVVNDKESKAENEKEYFLKRVLNEKNIAYFMNDLNDVSVTYEKKQGSKTATVSTGPYLGMNDLQKRNAAPGNPELRATLNKSIGQMADIKIFEVGNKVSFQKYKEFVQQTEEIVENLWK